MSTEDPSVEKQRSLVTTRKLAEANSVTPRTIFRWVNAGILPAPDHVINGRKYWNADRRPQSQPRGATKSA
jgi:hypothetical protein